MPLTYLVAAACAVMLAAPLLAQDPPPRVPGAPPPVQQAVFDTNDAGTRAAGTVPYFPLGESALARQGAVRAGMFVSSAGRRALAMGTEEGRFEFWSWPIKWLHDFELHFRVPKYTEPIPGHTIAQRVTVRPEGVTITYAYEQFTVQQHVFAALESPAIIMLLEVDAVRPLDIIARFRPDIHYAWPAGLGGQYLVWEQKARAFLFSEGKRSVNAFMGSPAVTEASDVLAHMLAAAPPQLVLGVGSAGERYTAPRLGEPPGRNVNTRTAYIPIVIAGGQMSRDSALALYVRLSAPGAARREWQRRVAHADSMRSTQLAVRTPDTLLNAAVEWAKVNLDDSFVCNPDLGCGVTAGYGLSGAASDRPGFGWFFGGDAAINSFAMSGVGQGALVREGVLEFFAKYQRADGKITHEISQSAGRTDWWSYPYAFYHGDTTPFWILAFAEYWAQTGDGALLRALWPKLEKAFAWSLATDKNGDGLMENPSAGAGALEVGDLQVGILSDVYMSGVWVTALDRMARMATAMRKPALSQQARTVRAKALATMEAKLWMPSEGHYAFALLQDGSVNPALTAWSATAMAFGVLQEERGAQMASRLASSVVTTDWGARPLASTNALFDPLHYNNGAVWGFITGFTSLAHYAYHNAPAGLFALQSVARSSFDHAHGRNPEVMSGRLYKPLDTHVPQQFFATSMVLTPLVRGLLGITVDAPSRSVRIAPHLPPSWDSVAVDHVPVGNERLSFTVRRRSGLLTLDVKRHGGVAEPLSVTFAPALPLGAGVAMPASPEGGVEAPAIEPHAGDVHVSLRKPVTDSASFAVGYTGGFAIEAPAMPPAVGARSKAPRILSERLEQGRYVVRLEGLAGQRYEFKVWEQGMPRMIAVTFPTEGANVEGYTTNVLRLSGQR